MATSSTVAFSFGFLPPPTVLTMGNYSMWYAQVSSTLNGAECWDYISPSAAPPSEFLTTESPVDPVTGKSADPKPNPAYSKCIAKDQHVLNYLFSSLSKEVFAQVSSAITAATLWAAIQGQHASQSRARVISTRMALAMASKGASTLAEYYTKMKGLADEMASAGRKLDDEELVSYILMGLDIDYESVVTSIAACVEPIIVPELYAQLVAHEQRVTLCGETSLSSTNMVAKGGRGSGSSNHSRGCGGHGGYGRGPRGVAAAAAAMAVAAISKPVSSAKCVASKATLPTTATNGTTPTSPVLRRRQRRLQLLPPTVWIPIGIWTP